MKIVNKLFAFILIVCSFSATAQTIDYNTNDDDYVAKGYDVVAYFQEKVKEGKDAFQTSHDGVKYRFSSQENLETFQSNPDKYVPQYGGYCAYAMSVKSSKMADVNPKIYEIRDGKLYLFYKSWMTNTLSLWEEKGPEKLIPKGDENWDKVKMEK